MYEPPEPSANMPRICSCPMSYVEHQLGKTHIIDVVWDNYRPDYLKAQGESVAASSPIMQFQKNWGEFLRINENNACCAVRISERRNCHNVN